MATVVVPVCDTHGPETGSAAVTPAAVTSADTATIVPGRGLTLHVLCGSTAGNLVITAGAAPAKTIPLTASKATCVRLPDSSYYGQSDGTIRFTVTQSVTATAITH
jgi:hypothetical protein